jgi:hypothetical protein
MGKISIRLGGALAPSFLLCAAMTANAADVREACQPRGGSASCPEYVVIVPSKATDGSVVVQPNVSTTLFGGITPPNGFTVQGFSPTLGFQCWVNDKGAAALDTGFEILNAPASPSLFTTPLGYKPMGPVSIFCSVGAPLSIEARAW